MTATTEYRAVDHGKLPSERSWRGLTAWLTQYWLVVLLVIEVAVFSALKPETFFSVANLQTILLQQVIPLVAAMALLFPLLVSEFDLSVGAATTACAVVLASFSRDGHTLVLALLATFALAVVIGAVNAFIVARLEVVSLIAGLGMATVIAGFISAYTEGLAVNRNMPEGLTALASDKLLGIPQVTWIAAAIAIVVWFILERTVYGRQLSAVGVNRRAAELLGLRVRLLVASTFICSAVLAGVCGALQVSIEAGGNPTSGGFGLVVGSLTAVFLGATCFKPGHFNVPGTVVGLLFVAAGVSGFALVGLEAWVQNVFTGVSLIGAIAISSGLRRRAGSR